MNTLPLTCRILGHGWKPSRLRAPNQVSAWQRTSCRRCVDIFLPTPRDEDYPRPSATAKGCAS